MGSDWGQQDDDRPVRKPHRPQTRYYRGHKIVKIADVGEDFAKWLDGQTTPLVEDSSDPRGWAYYSDYEVFIHNLPVTD